jgi:hypothetical protein
MSREPVKTDAIMSGIRMRLKTPAGNLHVIISVDMKTGREMEVFAQVGKAAGMASGNLEALCRITSLFLRTGGSLDEAREQMEGICANEEHSVLTKEGRVTSVADGLGKIFKRYLMLKEEKGLTALIAGEAEIEEEATDHGA